MTTTLNSIPRDIEGGNLFRFGQPIIDSWLGVTGKGVALRNTQVNDAAEYAGDFANSATGNRTLRATAAAHSITLNSGGFIVTAPLTLTGALAITGNVALTGNLTLTGHLLFSADATYDIGASGATRPRNLFMSGSAVVGGALATTLSVSVGTTLGVTGASTLVGAVVTGAALTVGTALGVGTGATIGTTLTVGTDCIINGALNHNGLTIGFHGATPQTKGTVTGSRGSGAALQSLLNLLSARGDLVDSSSP